MSQMTELLVVIIVWIAAFAAVWIISAKNG